MKSKAERVRPAAVAGRFYPANPRELRETVESLLCAAEPARCHDPVALIAPHAGYIYSGPVAASGYACWKELSNPPQRIVLIGPAHFVEVQGLAASSASSFETPLGPVPVDTEAVDLLLSEGLAEISDEAHAREHSLEVQLPFLQILLKEFTIVPLLAGQEGHTRTARVIDRLWNDSTRFVISSDLSHYMDWPSALRMDRATAQAIEKLKPDGIARDQACGQIPICGLLLAAKYKGLKPSTLDLRNSGDTAGPKEQVVGYGSFAFSRA